MNLAARPAARIPPPHLTRVPERRENLIPSLGVVGAKRSAAVRHHTPNRANGCGSLLIEPAPRVHPCSTDTNFTGRLPMMRSTLRTAMLAAAVLAVGAAAP